MNFEQRNRRILNVEFRMSNVEFRTAEYRMMNLEC